jgi:hypothetical protein
MAKAAVETVNHWILDFEAYQVGCSFFPVEIALLNMQNDEICYTWYIKYNTNMAKWDKPTKFQFNRHGLGWEHGNVYLHVALKELRDVLNSYPEEEEHVIHVKGLEKTNWVRHWFPYNFPRVMVQEIHGAPVFGEITCAMYACTYHFDHFHLRCARKKAYQLYLYLTDLTTNDVDMT